MVSMCPLSFASLCKIPGSGGSAASGNDFQLYIIGSYRYAFEYVTALNCGVWACFGLVAVKGPGGLRTRTAVVYTWCQVCDTFGRLRSSRFVSWSPGQGTITYYHNNMLRVSCHHRSSSVIISGLSVRPTSQEQPRAGTRFSHLRIL